MVDLDADRAVYKQIADGLRSAIASGELAPGAQLPSEHELVQTFGVARGTVRQAIILLRSEGLIESVHGVGSFVREREPAVVLRTDWSRPGLQIGRDSDDLLAEPEQEDGTTSSRDGLRIETTGVGRVRLDVDMDADLAQVAKRLGMRLNGSLLMRRWRELDGARVQATFTSYVAWQTAQRANLEHVPTGPAVYRALAAAGMPLDSYTEEVHARMPSESEVREMHLGPGVPVMSVLRTSYLADEIPLEIRTAVMSGDRYRLLYEVKGLKEAHAG